MPSPTTKPIEPAARPQGLNARAICAAAIGKPAKPIKPLTPAQAARRAASHAAWMASIQPFLLRCFTDLPGNDPSSASHSGAR